MNSHTTLAQADPWAPYDGKGKGKGHPVTPEAGDYGFVFLAIILIIFLLARYERTSQETDRP